jgi:hypothetical protein
LDGLLRGLKSAKDRNIAAFGVRNFIDKECKIRLNEVIHGSYLELLQVYVALVDRGSVEGDMWLFKMFSRHPSRYFQNWQQVCLNIEVLIVKNI